MTNPQIGEALRRGRWWLGIGLAAGLAWLCCVGQNSQAQEDKTLSGFMRKKLGASSQVLEGLTTEDAELIRQGTTTLLEMSKAEMWNVLADEDYREFNRDYRSSVRKLQEAAAKENFDNATLQWLDTVKSCVECHKYVRAQRVKTKK